jgi:predicted RNase H-like HicB family nuclease
VTSGARTVASQDVITIIVRQLPEGVWLATSEDVPGLIVEADTRDEAIDLARSLALDLLELDGQLVDRNQQHFAFALQNL